MQSTASENSDTQVSAWRRGWGDLLHAIHRPWFWVVEVVGGTVGGVITGVFTWDPDSSDVWGQVVVPGSAVLLFAAVVLGFSLLRAPVRQRNEAREQLIPAEAQESPSHDGELEALLTKVSRRQVTLNECLADAVQLARRLGAVDLERFCRQEIEGYPSDFAEDAERPQYRLVPAYASFTDINPMYPGWGGKAAPMFAHMRSNPDDFVPQQIFVGNSVATLEEKPSDGSGTSYGVVQRTHGEGHPDSEAPDTPIFLFYEAKAHRDVVEAIRGKLTEKILALLPEGPSG